MLPVLALVGRPNVGKSTLFNRLTQTRDAIVDDQPGVTRDRLYGRGRFADKHFLAVDTGGLAGEPGPFTDGIREQVEQVIAEAQVIVFMVDAAAGVMPDDRAIAERLRQSGVRVLAAVNKTEGVAPDIAVAEFQQLGLGAPFALSAKRGDGIAHLLDVALREFADGDEHPEDDAPVIALAGRPNVGKSTLANQLAGGVRVLVGDAPGTTRDSVAMRLSSNGQAFTLIDTAGVRRKTRGADVLEKFSVVKALQAIERANVVVLMIDAAREIGFQDAVIAGMIRDLGRSMVVAVNKWDNLPNRQRAHIKKELTRNLPFLPNAEVLFISALHGSNIAEVAPAALRAWMSAMVDVATSSLNRTLAQAVQRTPPPMRNRRTVRLKFAHQAGKNPPTFVIHGNLAAKLPDSYRRYLANYFARTYQLVGTPVRILFRTPDNPYRNRPSVRRTYKRGQRSGGR